MARNIILRMYILLATIFIIAGYLAHQSFTAPDNTISGERREVSGTSSNESYFKKLERYAVAQQAHDQRDIVHKTIKENSQFQAVDVVYPQFLDDFACINKDIENFIANEIAEHAARCEQDYRFYQINNEPYDFFSRFPYRCNGTYHMSYKDDRFTSFYLELDCYGGGAHGYRFWKVFNYDLQEQRYLTIQDFVPNEIMLDRLRLLCKEALKRENPSIVLANSNCTTYKDFELFNFTPKTFTIQFDEYQVCCYAMGAPTVTIESVDLYNSGV